MTTINDLIKYSRNRSKIRFINPLNSKYIGARISKVPNKLLEQSVNATEFNDAINYLYVEELQFREIMNELKDQFKITIK